MKTFLIFYILIISLGCTTALPGTKDIAGRKYLVPININAPETLTEGTSNYQ